MMHLLMKKSLSRFAFKLFENPICFRALLVGILVVFMYSAAKGEEGEEGQDGLKITSKTKLQSAKFNLGLSQDSAEDDLKRKSIGVGETITINLEAKDALIGNVKELEWKVDDKKGVLILPNKMKGIKTIELTANPVAKETGEVKITVKTDTGATSKPYDINVVVPTGAVAMKIAEGQDTPPEIQNQMPGVPFASAWMIVRLTIYPLEVNFSKMKVLEEDEGYVDPSHNGENRPPHHPKSVPVQISPKNQFHDEVALDFPMTKDRLAILDEENPFTWGHKCWFRFATENLQNKDFTFGAGIVATTMNCRLSKNEKGITIGIDKFTSKTRPVEVTKTTPLPNN